MRLIGKIIGKYRLIQITFTYTGSDKQIFNHIVNDYQFVTDTDTDMVNINTD